MPTQKSTKFRWHPRREKAAPLIAADELTDEQIAAKVGVTRDALNQWKRHPEFQERVETIRAEWREKLRLEGLASQQYRVDELNDMYRRMRRVVEERASDPEMESVPGGSSGVLVHQIKAIGVGKNQQVVDEYAFDRGLVQEMRAHTEQVAKEVGQWAEKSETKHDASDSFLEALRAFGHGADAR